MIGAENVRRLAVSELSDEEITVLCAKALGWKHLGGVGIALEPNGRGGFNHGPDDGSYWCMSGHNDWWLSPAGGRVCRPCMSIPDPLKDKTQAMDLVIALHLYFDGMLTDDWTAAGSVGAKSIEVNDKDPLRAICLCSAKIQQAMESAARPTEPIDK